MANLCVQTRSRTGNNAKSYPLLSRPFPLGAAGEGWSALQGKDAAGDAAGSAKSAAGGAAGKAKSLGGDVSGSAKDAAGSVKKAGKEAAGSFNAATPDLSANPLDDLFGKVSIQRARLKSMSFALPITISCSGDLLTIDQSFTAYSLLLFRR